MSGRPPFQEASVRLIAERLTDRIGAKRFLLADEVGLGKTHVAKGVIDELARRSPRPLVVLYISSSREIAHQNRKKLSAGTSVETVDDRLTLFARHVRPETPLKKGSVRLLTLTPGTSLFLGRSTGVREERRVLLHLIRRVRPNLFTAQCRRLFQCNVADANRWRAESEPRELRKLFPRGVAPQLLKSLRSEWRQPLKDLAAATSGKRKSGVGNRVIGDLRRGLARAVLQALQPGLIILDEFQRFREVLVVPPDQGTGRAAGELNVPQGAHVLEDWFTKRGGPPILLLSATPYRLFATRLEDPTADLHFRELFEVLHFLTGPGADRRIVDRLRARFERFRKSLEEARHSPDPDWELLELKAAIESDLKKFICRTERNWYYLDVRKGIDDQGAAGVAELPTRDEAAELRSLTTLMVDHAGASVNQVIDYWKSAPACLAFMFDNYEVQRRLKKQKIADVSRLEHQLLPSARDLPKLIHRNAKLRNLLTKALPTDEPWRHLWCDPSYRYWEDGLDSPSAPTSGPSKFLIFSHWRFVPGAIALLASHAAERHLGCDGPGAWDRSEPLRFRQDLALGAFDICFPSPALSEIVDPLAIAAELTQSEPKRPVRLRDVERVAAVKLRDALKDVGVTVSAKSGNGRRASIWGTVAKMDRHWKPGGSARDRKEVRPWIVDALRRHRPASGSSVGDVKASYERRTLEAYRSLLTGDQSERAVISRRQFDRILQVALHSPAVCLMRSVRRAVPDAPIGGWWPVALSTGLSGIRHYFNRPFARAIIERATRRRRGYAERALSFCARAHFQAMLDEFAHLLSEQEHRADLNPEEVASAVLGGIDRVMSLGVGAPRVRLRSAKAGRRGSTVQRRSHFAMAFAEESAKGGAGRQRRRHTREAFNSPFWPFVLATTSVGQEGLDFHWYCRDVVHWNLPTNPVDLEQREGRINRRNGLVVRSNIAKEVPFKEAVTNWTDYGSLWAEVFAKVGAAQGGVHLERHGLFPHWLFEGATTAPDRIRRRVVSYWGSRDNGRYARLKQDLALYRLAFGQVNQEDFLARLRERVGQDDGSRLSLESYMLNLGPFSKGDGWSTARREARQRLKVREGRREWFRTLLADTRQIVDKEVAALKPEAVEAASKLHQWLSGWLRAPSNRAGDRRAELVVAALIYLRNPYDDRFDTHRPVGFEDDASRLIDAAKGLVQARLKP